MRILAAMLALLCFIFVTPRKCCAAPECWEVRLILDVPQVRDNSSSLGYRKYERQKLKGFFTVEATSNDEPVVTFCSLRNLSYAVGGSPVTYDTSVTATAWHLVGSNATDVFNTRSVSLSIMAEPSYIPGVEAAEDNSLVLTLSGKGDAGKVSGYAAGVMGCGCSVFGHTSPTRIWGSGLVTDTAAVYGRFQAKRIR